MNDKVPPGLQRLWEPAARDAREPRLGLSLERVVVAAIELADADGLGAVSMSRVAQRLGFTTMSLYRYVKSKDELLLLMHDTAWQPPATLDDVLVEGWRPALEHWCREMRAAMQRHPWLEQIRVGDRLGTPSQLAWLDRGLRALRDTGLPEHEKSLVLLLLNGHVFADARMLADMMDAARSSGIPLEVTAGGYGEMLRVLAVPERFPDLHRAVESGSFDPDQIGRQSDPEVVFSFGLDRILDGVERLVSQRRSDSSRC